MRSIAVKSPDGTTIAAFEAGNPAGPAILFIHGFMQCHLATMIDGTRAFLRACFERQPDDGDFAFMLGYNMVAPTPVRAAVLSREPNRGDLLATLTCPVLVSHGSKDPFMLPAMAQFTAAQCKNVRLSMYDGVGHSTFYEDAPRFNRELAEFVRAAQ